MKKVLFCLQSMYYGGIENELITVLKKLDPSQIQATVLLMFLDDPETARLIPDWIPVINPGIDRSYYLGNTSQIVRARIRGGHVFEAASLMVKRALGLGMTLSSQSITDIPARLEQYDTAVCYNLHSPLAVKYVAEKVSANRKIAWIHSSFKTSGYPVQKLGALLSHYDQFVGVSHAVTEEFKALCPQHASKAITIHNILDENEIWEKSKEAPENDPFFSDTRPRILSVGRFSEEKGFDLAIEVCRILKNQGLSFCWYLIGSGDEESLYRSLIAQYGLQDCVSILGRKQNPYPYFANCTVYVQPSRHEGFSITTLEARILNKPIVCTRFSGSEEQIIQGETGYIVPVGDVGALTEKVRYLLDKPAERKRLSDNLAKSKINALNIEKVIAVLSQ